MGLAPKDFVPLDRRFERAISTDTVDYWAEVLADGENPRDWSWGQSGDGHVTITVDRVLNPADEVT
jgi:hypothetical protein